MSMSDARVHDSTAIDGILRGLANRPNVQATLILSRKDGSIIRATGFEDNRNGSNLARQSYPAPEVPGKHGPEHGTPYTDPPADISDIQDKKLSRAELLATSIYAFVNVSTALAESMSLSDSVGDYYSGQSIEVVGRTCTEPNHPPSSSWTAEQDVQLLRMRTRRQEIIIFPDPSYLSCVVQNIGKGGT